MFIDHQNRCNMLHDILFQVSKDVAKVDEAFSYLRSQSEGREGSGVINNIDEDKKEKVIPKSPVSNKKVQHHNSTKIHGLSREEKAGRITISDAVVDSSKDYDSLEPQEVYNGSIEKNNHNIG